MRPLHYSINVTLDGCCDHRSITPDEAMHRHAAEWIDRADALLFGRTTYQMMEAGWREMARTGVVSNGMPEWVKPFALTIDAKKKYVVSSTLPAVDWNAELVKGELGEAVRKLKAGPGGVIATGGVTLPLALAEMGLIDEYQLVIHPRISGGGRKLFEGLSAPLDLRLIERTELPSGAVVVRYVPAR